MAKFYGAVGFAEEQVETSPGVWKDVIVPHNYYGELVQNTIKLQSADQLNDDINVANKISIVADPYANKNFHAMRYVEFMGAKWKISSVEVLYPKLILTIGGVYNGQ